MMSTKGPSSSRMSAMPAFKHVTDDLSVSPQISLADVAEAARLGFTTLIKNRPDGEEPGQLTSA